MSYLEGDTVELDEFEEIYNEIVSEKVNQMNKVIKKYENKMQLHTNEVNRRKIINFCFDNIIKSEKINNNYVLSNYIFEKGRIIPRLINQDKLKKVFFEFKNIFNKYIEESKKLLDENKNDSQSIQKDREEELPSINIQIRFLSNIYYLFQDKKDLIEFIEKNIMTNEKIANKIENEKSFFDNENNFEKKEFSILEEAKFYIHLFLDINYLNGAIEYIFENNNFIIKKINQEINNLLYIEQFKKIIGIQKNSEIINELCDIIYQIYNISDKIKELINECKDKFQYNIDNNLNIFHLLKYIIIQSEKDDIINIKPHSLLCKKGVVKINVEDKKDDFKELYFYSNNTIKDIYHYLMKNNNSKNFVFFNMNNINEKDEQYKSLNEYDKKVLIKISQKEIKKNISTLLKEGSLTQKFKDILKSWFNYFSKGKENMTRKDLAECFNALTDKKPNKFTEENNKIPFFLKIYSDNLQYILLDNFINFFFISIEQGKRETVWKNIENMKLRNDLSKMPQIKENKYLPRYYLSNETDENKDMNLMNIFKEKYKNSTSKEIYDFMLFLSTDEKLYDYILNKFNYDENMKFSKRQDEHLYNLYIINIITSIIEDVELKRNKNKKLSEIKVCENDYYLYNSDNNIDLKNKFFIDFIKNNYSDLIEFAIKNIEKINELDNEKDKEKLDIIIKLNGNCLELINRIYNYYHNETKNEDFTLGKNSLKEFIEENNLAKEIIEEVKYKDLLMQIMKFFDKYYLNENNIYDKLKGLFDNSFSLLISLTYEKKDIFNDIINNKEKKELLIKILNYILMQVKQKNNTNYAIKLMQIKSSIEEINIFLLEFSFTLLKNLEDKKVDNILSLYLKKILGEGIKSDNKRIKNKVFEFLFNYINDNSNDKKSGAFFHVFSKLLEDEKYKNDLMEEKYKGDSIFELIYKKINNKEEELLKMKYQKYEDLKNFLNVDIDKEKYIKYDILKKKIDELFNSNNNGNINNNEQVKSLTDNLITSFKTYIQKNPKNFKLIKKIIISLNQLAQKEKDEFNINSSESSQSQNSSSNQDNKIQKTSPYTGIRNLGTLCYLGSIVQQLFWIKKFRNSILSVNDLKPVDKSYQYTDDDNTLHQTQKLYTYLLLSSYGEVVPKDFIFSIKIFGDRVELRRTLDSSEFYHNFCDIINNSLENTKYKTLIEDIFCGKTQEKKICSNCNNESNKEDEFKLISLEVKDKKDLYESLDQYISEEVIDDYKCDKCNKKVKLKKLSLFSSLPNILVFHLKRIIYNNKGEMEKITSKFDFPKDDLNIKKYCLDKNKVDEYYKYNLIGINIHKGNANAGHYINLVKTSKEENKWYLFDDSSVEEYDFNKFDDMFNKNEKSSNTYILFYESIKEKETKIPDEQLMNKEYLLDVFNDNKTYDYLYGKKIIDLKNNLVQLLCDLLNNESYKLKEEKFDNLEIKDLLNLSIKIIVNFYSSQNSRNNPEEKDIKNLLNIINKLFMPIIQDDELVNESYKLDLIKEMNKNLFTDKNIKLFFSNNVLKESNQKLYELIHLIIETNKEEDDNIFKKNELQEKISFIFSREKNLSNYLYKIFYELITYNQNEQLNHIDENSFIDLFYGIKEEENPENFKDISNIFEYYIVNKNILDKNEIKKLFIEDSNFSLVKILFDESKPTLIKIIQKLQCNNKGVSDTFNLDIIQKLYNYCLKDKNKTREKQIKLIQLIYDILDIKDMYIGYRARILLGFPTLVMLPSDNNLLQLFGINILSNDINKEIFEYSNYNLIKKDRCVLAYLFPSIYYKNEENKLEENDKCDLIYELINRTLGLNEKKEGNYFLFKTLYLMQSRSIKYDNLYQEMKSILAKTGNNKYDLNKINEAEKEVILLINYEVEKMRLNIKTNNNEENKKDKLKPNLPEQYNKWKDTLDLKFNINYIGCLCDIFPDKIGKIEIIRKINNKKFDILRFKFYTTYFTKKELIDLSNQNKQFKYEEVDRNSPSITKYKNKEKILDFSIFRDKKNIEEFISYIIELLKTNDKVIIENKEIINKFEIKNTLEKFYAFSYDKKNVFKSLITFGEMFLDEINNFYLPEYIYNSIEKNQAVNLFNVHALKNEYQFFESNDLGISVKCIKYDKYYKDIFN